MTTTTFSVRQLPCLGKTIAAIYCLERGSGLLTLHFTDYSMLRFWHTQDCCESVEIADIVGDPAALIGQPLLRAEERTRVAISPEVSESGTWTFYEFATVNGSVTVSWLGESNGYYSEAVTWDLRKA